MEKITRHLLITCILSLCLSGLFGCNTSDENGSFFHDKPTQSRVARSVNFEVESPFVNSYGIYSLADPNHNINNYISSIPLEFSQETSTILIKAPYLVYTNENNRYYYGSVVDTVSGTSSLGPYDTWSVEFNKQPFIAVSSNIVIKGYHGNSFVSNLSFSLSGTASSPGYYLQNLSINVIIPNNITSLRLYFNKVCYSSSYHEVVDVEDVYKTIPYKEEMISKTVSKTIRTTRAYTNETVNFTVTSGYYFKSFDIDYISGVSNSEILSSNLETGSVTYKIYFSEIGSQKAYSFRAKALTYKPSSSQYEKTITTTYIDTYNTLNPTLNITKDDLYRYPKYFLTKLTCSGRGDITDQNMVTNAWSDLEEMFELLPTSYKSSFSNGTLDDPYLLDTLMRYDYVVFYKNYGLNDFASRDNSSNRYYMKKEYHPIIKEKDSVYLIIIIGSLISILSISILAILLVKKKTIQQE